MLYQIIYRVLLILYIVNILSVEYIKRILYTTINVNFLN